MLAVRSGGLNWQLRQDSNRSHIHRRKLSRQLLTGPYIDSYDAELTNKIIRADKRYKSGADSARIAVYESRTRGGTGLSPNLVTKSAKAGK
jgi:hypothetical protein